MKIASVIPDFKSDDQSKFTHYRPISVLPAFPNLLNNYIYKQMLAYIEKYNILNDKQYGL